MTIDLLKLNSNKTGAIIFSRKKTEQFSFQAGGVNIIASDEIELLGLSLPFNMKFHAQVNKTVKKAWKTLYYLYQLKYLKKSLN